MTMPEGPRAKAMRPGEGRYVVIGERARCTFKVVSAETRSGRGRSCCRGASCR
jgi:hypothetical protein